MKKYAGYSLIELLVTLVVLAILFTVGAPKIAVFFKGNHMVVNANDLLSGLHIARSESIKRNSRVSICKSANAGDAVPTCVAAGGVNGWENGWIVFVEGNTGNIGEYTTADGAILKVNTGAQGAQVTITASNANIGNYVSFSSRGAPKMSNGTSQSGEYRICDERGLKNAAGNVVARAVVLNASGRVRTTKDATKIGSCP